MTRELNRVALAVLVGFALLMLTAAFWAVVEADNLLEREDNARRVIAEQRIARGAIYDAQGSVLAHSEEIGRSGLMRRVYPAPAASGAVGYYSFTYGEAGIEAAFNGVLRGDDARSDWQSVWDRALHLAQVGGDVRSTLKLGVQQAATAALGDASGAVVVVAVPSGRVLAIVSLPDYDPNTLDADWDRLAASADAPLLNRVTAGVYQPGGAWQTVILAALLASYPDLQADGGYVMNGELEDAQSVVRIDDLALGCLPGTPDEPLTLALAYAYGCPASFARVLEDGALTPARLWERLEVLGLLEPPALPGFPVAPGTAPRALTSDTDPAELRAALVGQGALTVSPLQMVQLIAAVANGGNAVPLHVVDAVRPADSEAWRSLPLPARRPALLRGDVARALALVMQQAAAENPTVGAAAPDGATLYGHSALAFAGPEHRPYAWFTGFVTGGVLPAGEAIAAVVVVENEGDPAAAARVAGAAFEAALAE